MCESRRLPPDPLSPQQIIVILGKFLCEKNYDFYVFLRRIFETGDLWYFWRHILGKSRFEKSHKHF